MTRITSKWARRLIQIVPSQWKQWVDAHVPGLKRSLGDYAYNRIDQSALQQFVRTHRHDTPTERSFDNGLAVVIPCYNHARYLDATVHCLLHQTHRPFQAIFVEDRSTDDTWLRLQDLATQFPDDIQVTLLQTSRNLGQAAAINLGVETTNASICTILNDDDYLIHDALEAILAILRFRSDLYLLGTGSCAFAGNNVPPQIDEKERISNRIPQYSVIPLVEYIPQTVQKFTHPNSLNMTHSGTTFFRSVWQTVGGYYPEKDKRVVVFSDRDFQLRVASLFPVGVSLEIPFSFWRSDSSVDSGTYS